MTYFSCRDEKADWAGVPQRVQLRFVLPFGEELLEVTPSEALLPVGVALFTQGECEVPDLAGVPSDLAQEDPLRRTRGGRSLRPFLMSRVGYDPAAHAESGSTFPVKSRYNRLWLKCSVRLVGSLADLGCTGNREPPQRQT